MGILEFAGEVVDTLNAAGKSTAAIGLAGVLRGDKVGQCVVSVAGGFALLLAEGMDFGEWAAVLVVEPDVVADGVCGEEANHAAGAEAFFGNDALEECLRVVVEAAGLLAVFFVVEYLRVDTFQFPSPEEGGVIKVLEEGLQIDVIFHRESGPSRSGDLSL